jgi:hypothetical protein
MAKTRKIEQRTVACSVYLLLFLALSGAICWKAPTAHAADEQSYEVEIAGRSFDPKSPKLDIPLELRLSPAALEKYKKEAGYYLVQLHRSPDAETSTQLKAHLGVKLQDYVPELSYVEKLTPSAVAAAKADPRIRSVIPYEPAFKLSPHIGTFVPRTAERKAAPGLLLTAFLFPDADVDAVSRSIASVGGTGMQALDDRRLKGGTARIQFSLPSDSGLPEMARIEGIRWIEEVGEIIEDNSDAAATTQSGHVHTPSIWNRGLHGKGEIVGIIESSGILDINHCFFRDRHHAIGKNHRKVVALPHSTAKGHPTFTAGIIAGDDIDNPGAHRHRGGAWESRLAVGKWNSHHYKRSLHDVLMDAAKANAFIHSNSWHYNVNEGSAATYNQTAFDVDTFAWENQDHLVLGSVGNRKVTPPKKPEGQGAPGTAKNAIAIGAAYTDPDKYGDGNRGPTAEGRRKPDVMAPGCSIQSALVGPRGRKTCRTGHRSDCATSYATPQAAAAAALVRQYFREGWYPSGIRVPQNSMIPSGALMKAMLINSAVRMYGVDGYPNDIAGWGVIRLQNVLLFDSAAHNLKVEDNRTGISTDQTHPYELVVANAGKTEQLKVVLVWTDPPPRPGTSPKLINDLNLAVVSPDGSRTFLGNFFHGGASTTGGSADRVNNVEVVLVNNPAAGKWTVSVVGNAVKLGPQPYALVMTLAGSDR